MKLGDLVVNLNSESRMIGIVVGWSSSQGLGSHWAKREPVVKWSDGRCSWIVRQRVEVIGG